MRASRCLDMRFPPSRAMLHLCRGSIPEWRPATDSPRGMNNSGSARARGADPSDPAGRRGAPAAGFALLQPDEIRQRFLHAVKELTPEMADELTHPDAKREFALVAAEPLPPGEALVGAVARAAISATARAKPNSRSWSAITSPAWAWAGN